MIVQSANTRTHTDISEKTQSDKEMVIHSAIFPKQLCCKGSSKYFQASGSDADPESVAGCWLLGGCWDWFYSKTNGFLTCFSENTVNHLFFNIFERKHSKTRAFSTLSSENTITPMVF